jgi:IclR family KDG regulon transcriptional repressor
MVSHMFADDDLPTQAMTPRPESGIKSVHMTFDVLEAVAECKGDVGVTELAAQLGSTKTTIFRHLQTLVERGYLARNPSTARYRLGVRAYLLGRAATDRYDLLEAAQPAFRELRDSVRQTVALGAVGPRGVTILETLLSQSTLEIGVRPGSELRFHATAQGKIALAFTRQPLMEWLRQQTLERFTDHTVCDLREIESQIRLARERGWASAPQEMVLGINGIAAPVLDDTGDCVATLTIVGSVQFVRATPDALQIRALQEAAYAISVNLGYSGPAVYDRPSDGQDADPQP